MSIIYSPTLTKFSQLLQSFLKAVEGESNTPYVDSGDSNKNGVPTIGWGFALNNAHGIGGFSKGNPIGIDYLINTVLGVNASTAFASLNSVDRQQEAAFELQLKNVLNQYWSPNNSKRSQGGDTPGLNFALNAILKARIDAIGSAYSPADRARLGVPVSTFSMSPSQMAGYLATIEPTIMSRVAKRVGQAVPGSVGQAVPGNSSEGIALFAMAYVGNLAGRIKKALDLTNSEDARAKAWDAIRYLGASGYVIRAYQESAMFSLYGTNADGTAVTIVSDASALAADRVFSANWQSMYAYDAGNAQVLADANTNLAQSGLASVPQLPAALQPAANTLNADFGHGQVFNSVDIGVAADSVIGVSTVNFAADINNDLMIGGFVDSTLKGGGGTNTYDYSPTAANVSETIVNGSSSAGAVWVGGNQINGPGSSATIIYKGGITTWISPVDETRYSFAAISADGNIGTLTIGQGLLENGDEIVIDNFNLQQAGQPSGYLGIHLIPAVALTSGSVSNPFGSSAYLSGNAVNATGNLQTITIFASEISDLAQQVVLRMTGGASSLFNVILGTGEQNFVDGSMTLTIPAGQSSVTVALNYTGNSNQAERSVSMSLRQNGRSI